MLLEGVTGLLLKENNDKKNDNPAADGKCNITYPDH